MERMVAASIHNRELQETFELWQEKPLIRAVYRDFYLLIRSWLVHDSDGTTVELGAGFGGLKSVHPNCIATDLFDTPWIDQIENAYQLSFDDRSISNLVMMDVFHHLEYPGEVLAECLRVLKPGGRLLLLEPDVGMLGYAVYSFFHHEPLGLREQIRWRRENSESNRCPMYYAAQANAFRIFARREFGSELDDWRILRVLRLASLSYVMAGGLRKRQLYPTAAYGWMKKLDRVCDFFPWLFSTRMLVVLEKKEAD